MEEIRLKMQTQFAKKRDKVAGMKEVIDWTDSKLNKKFLKV